MDFQPPWVAHLLSGMQTINEKLEQLASRQEQLASGQEQLASRQEQLASGQEQLVSKVDNLTEGMRVDPSEMIRPHHLQLVVAILSDKHCNRSAELRVR